jgi:flagellar hook protein FlgE
MLSSLSAGVSGLENFQEQMDVIGNNIANLNTTGFKAGIVNFSDALSDTLQGVGTTTPAEQVGTGVQISSIGNNWSLGAISTTGVSTDLAITGNSGGYFEVVDPTTSNTSYLTQDGSFSLNSSGYLVTSNGDFVQGMNSQTGALGNIQVTTDPAKTGVSMTSYTIDSTGQIEVAQSDGTTYISGQVMLQNVTDPQMMVNVGNNLYSNWQNAGPNTALGAPGSSGMGTIQSGALESSNVDLSNEMANLITAQQAFDASSKMITTSNEVLQTVVNMKQS